MGNMFEKYAADREAEQKKIEKTVSVADDAAEPAVEEKRTTLSLSLTVSDMPVDAYEVAFVEYSIFNFGILGF